MDGRYLSMRIAILAGTGFLCALLAGCAPREMSRGGASSSTQNASPRAKSAGGARDTAAAAQESYDVRDEMPEESPRREAPLVERIEPIGSDTISVQDVAVEEAPAQRYDIGYRVQVHASADRAAAEAVRKKIAAETSMSAYLEYEEGLYKVRVGDFAERKDAAQARAKLAGAYPGSWIVRTTIRR